MRAARVSWQRVVHEHRRALVPLAIVLVINLGVLVGVVLPLNRLVAGNEDRAAQSARALRTAEAEFRGAESLREGKAQATKDLETFYAAVLPSNVAAARRVLNSKVLALAKEHGVDYQSGASDTESIQGSTLERLVFSLTLAGDYNDIRAMIHDLETAPEFIVIDNIVLSEGRDPNAPLTWALELSTYYRSAAARARIDGQ